MVRPPGRRSINEAGQSVADRRIAFFPKAFAANRRLPDFLHDVSIPIVLERKQPGSPCRRFHQDNNGKLASSLRASLRQWYQDHKELLAKIPTYEESQFPPELSSRQQDCAEPLLHIADLIGGDWPRLARNALVNAFALSAFEDFYASKQVLIDIHDLFAAKDDPGWISTKDLLEFLPTLDDRAWDEWSKGKPLNSKDLAALLAPFGIKSKNHRTGEDDKVAKGYNREDFKASWQRHVLTELFRRARKEMQDAAAQRSVEEKPLNSAKPLAADSQNSTPQNPRPVAGSQKPVAGSVAADLQSSHNDSQPAAVLSCQAKDSSQKLAAGRSPVAADLQNLSAKQALVDAILGVSRTEQGARS